MAISKQKGTSHAVRQVFTSFDLLFLFVSDFGTRDHLMSIIFWALKRGPFLVPAICPYPIIFMATKLVPDLIKWFEKLTKET